MGRRRARRALLGRPPGPLRLRSDTLKLGGDKAGYRLVSSEGDGLSGLTVDRYDRWAVAQFTSLALFERRELLVPHTQGTHGRRGHPDPDGACDRRAGRDPAPVRVGARHPTGRPVEVVEHGLTYWIDLRAGQKTGFFLDQRLNRLAASVYCRRPRRARPLLLHRAASLCARGKTARQVGARASTARPSPSRWRGIMRRSTALTASSSRRATRSPCSNGSGRKVGSSAS